MAWSDALAAQYTAATTALGVVRLDGWTTLRLVGVDRASFLHNMCTNDIRNLPVGGQCEAFLTDVKGKIVGHVVVLAEPDQLTLITVPEQADNLIAHLNRYIIREDVRLTDDSRNRNWAIYFGWEEPVDEPSIGQPFHRLGPEITVAPCTFVWLRGAWIGTTNDVDFDALDADGCTEPVWHALRIESGWPLFGVDFDSSHLPQEVGRDARAINFRKGCYLGQETIARIDALGHVNKRLATVRLAEEAPVGAELTAGGQVVGALSSVTWSPRLEAWLALAMLRRGHNEPGSKLECNNQPAEVVPTPAVAA